MKYFSLVILLIASNPTRSQVLNLQPIEVDTLDFSPGVQKEWEIRDKALKSLNSGEKEWGDLTQEEAAMMEKHPDIYEDMWDIIGGGDGWYDVAYIKSVKASSFLPSQGTNSYAPENAHDHSYQNAWVEGVKGYGIGELLTYTFPAECPRINKVIVVNGYVKSRSSWQNNSRVKQLKMYVNDELFAYLNLTDEQAAQVFEVPLIGNSDRDDLEALSQKPDWEIKFEITEVYKGSKWDDVAISEIYFDGVDVY